MQVDGTDLEGAERVKARIQKTTLKDITEYIEQVYANTDYFLIIKLNMDKIKLLKLEVNVNSICNM